MNRLEIAIAFQELQSSICEHFEAIDKEGSFIKDEWTREGGGGGLTRPFTDGSIIEKGGVNFSAVHGETPAKILEALNLEKSDFFATGVSIVLHPKNPHVPIIHMNVRYFEMSNGIYWFGGGIDLTPHYVKDQDATYFHSIIKRVCDQANSSYYKKFKTWADDYFYLKHRDETRGVGGIFFDRLSESEEMTKENLFDFVMNLGNSFKEIYSELIQRNCNKEYTEEQKEWQKLRRGRYVEFNLLYDKGTKFGLDTNGRTESILISMPPVANWMYNFMPKENSPEAYTLSKLKKGIDWLTVES